MKILLADDHKIIRNVLSKFLEEELKAEIIQANNGIEAINLYKEKGADLIIADINMPKMDGIQMVEQIKSTNEEVKIIALSMMDDSVSIKKMIKAGANAYVLKEGDSTELLMAIDKVLNGETYYSKAVTETIITSMMEKKVPHKHAELTKRELEILELIFKEKSNQEIADTLYISQRTVEAHKHNIMEKTGSKNIAGLVKFAIREKLFDDMFY